VLEGRASKRSVNVEHSDSETIEPRNKYLDSGIKLTYVADCTGKENIDTGKSFCSTLGNASFNHTLCYVVKLKDIIGDVSLGYRYCFKCHNRYF
jgi:hypothetical protein